MRAVMDGLPTELLDLILDFVDVNRQTFNHGYQYEAFYRDFHALSLTSKTLHQLSRPRLYRHFQSLHKGRGVVKLVRTLCEIPTLAQHLEVIDVAPSASLPSTFQGGLPSQMQLTKSARSALSNVMWTLGERLAMSDAVLGSCSTAWMLILLCLAQRMRSITIRDTDEPAHAKRNGCKHCPLVPDALSSVFAPARLQLLPKESYSALRHFSIESKRLCAPPKTSAWALFSIMHLPALETLECIRFGARQTPAHIRLRAQRMSSVRHLELRDCNLDATSIHDILKTCTNLEVLTIALELENSPVREDAAPRVDVQELMLALRTQKHSLRKLTLTNISNFSTVFTGQPGFGSLRDFERLEELAIDEMLLVDGQTRIDFQRFWEHVKLDHILPSNLRALTFHSADYIGLSFEKILRAMSTYHVDRLRFFSVTFPKRPYPQLWTLEEMRDRLARNNNSFILEERISFQMPRVYFEHRWLDGEDDKLQNCLTVFEDSEDSGGS